MVLNKYVRQVLDSPSGVTANPKFINNRIITARELYAYFQTYVTAFTTTNTGFPEAKTILAATAEANNRNAFMMSTSSYKNSMEIKTANKGYLRGDELFKISDESLDKALSVFEEIARFGNEYDIQTCKTKVLDDIKYERARYMELNTLKNPFKGVEVYIIPLVIAIISRMSAACIDVVCSLDVCHTTGQQFRALSFFIIIALLIYCFSYFKQLLAYASTLFPLLMAGSGGKLHTD